MAISSETFPLQRAIKQFLDDPSSRPKLPSVGPDKEEPDIDDSDQDDSDWSGNLGLFPESWFVGASNRAVPLARSQTLAEQSSLSDVMVADNIFGAPAMAIYDDTLYCVYEGLKVGQEIKRDGWLWVAFTNDGRNWLRRKLPDHGTTGPPALAVYRGKLYCVHEGQDNRGWLWFCSFDGEKWSKDKKMSHGVGTRRRGFPSAALVVYGGLLYCVHEGQRGSSGEGWLWFCSFDGEEWSKDKRLPKHGTSGAPGLAVYDGKIVCCFEGQNTSGRMWYATFDGDKWSKAKRALIPEKSALGKRSLGKRSSGGTPLGVMGTPDLETFNNELYLVYENATGGEVRSLNNTGAEDRTLVVGSRSSEPSPMSTSTPPAVARINETVYVARNTGAGQLRVAVGSSSAVTGEGADGDALQQYLAIEENREENDGLGTFEIIPRDGIRTTYSSYLEWVNGMRRSSGTDVAVRFEIDGVRSPWILVGRRDFYVTAYADIPNPWDRNAWRTIPSNQINYDSRSIPFSVQTIQNAMFRVRNWADGSSNTLERSPSTLLIFLSAEAARFDGVAFAVNALLRGQRTDTYDWLNFRTLLTNWSYISENIYNLPRGGLQTGVSLFIARALAGSRGPRRNQALYHYMNELANLGYPTGYRGN